MKKICIACFLLIILAGVIIAHGEEVKVTFTVTAPTVDDTSAVYIVGNHGHIGNWDPGTVKLKRISADTWSSTFRFPLD